MTDERGTDYPIVYSLQGGPSDDGSILLVEATGFDGNIVRFGIPLENVQHVVAFLLVWAATIGAPRAGNDKGDAQSNQGVLPIPATSVAVGHANGGEGYLGISVGLAELMFALPVSALGPLGQSLIMAGTLSPRPS